MSKKDSVTEVNENTSKNNNKKKVIIAVVGVILLAIIIFLIWFFNRKFDVTFDLANGTKEEIVLVKYNKVVDEKNIKTKEDLGDSFINWYQVIDEVEGKDILDEKPFDFDTKIKEDIKLKAVYEGKVETVTISFDSKGGSKVDSKTINKGTALKLPSQPTYNGYKFVSWVDEKGKTVANNTKFDSDATLYAKWEKVKVEEPKKETPKQEKGC